MPWRGEKGGGWRRRTRAKPLLYYNATICGISHVVQRRGIKTPLKPVSHSESKSEPISTQRKSSLMSLLCSNLITRDRGSRDNSAHRPVSQFNCVCLRRLHKTWPVPDSIAQGSPFM